MVKRFPHTIVYTTAGTPGGWDDDNGIPIPGTPGETVTAKCRAQENLRENYTVQDSDGNRISFRFVIHMDKSSIPIAHGQDVEIFRDNEPLATGTVKRFHPGQLHNRIWI